MEYADNDLWARLERAKIGNAPGIVKDVHDIQNDPRRGLARLAEEIDEIMNVTQLSVRLGCSTEVAESARVCLKALRSVKPFFEYLYEYETMTKADEDATDHVLALLRAPTDEESMRILIGTKAMPPARLANVVQKYAVRWGISRIPPVAGTIATDKLRQLENKLKAK